MNPAILSLTAAALFAFAACQQNAPTLPPAKPAEPAPIAANEPAPTAEPSKPATAKPAPTPVGPEDLVLIPDVKKAKPSKAPKEFVIEIWENGDMKFDGDPVTMDDFAFFVMAKFASYRAGGAKTMPPFKFNTHGTVTMGIRHEIETQYARIKERFEATK